MTATLRGSAALRGWAGASGAAVALTACLLGAPGCGPGGAGTATPGVGGSVSAAATGHVRAASDPVCTADAECGGGRLCIDTHCKDPRAWADAAAAERRRRAASVRSIITSAGKVLAEATARSAEATKAAFAADGEAAWKVGYSWRGGAVSADLKGARFELLGDMDVSGPTPVPDLRTATPVDVAPLLKDLDEFETRLADLAAVPADLKAKLDTLDARLLAHEYAADGLLHPPIMVRGFIRDVPIPKAPLYPGCKSPPIRRAYVAYFYVPRTGAVPVRIAVSADSPADVNFVPERPCAQTIRWAASPKALHIFTPKMHNLTAGAALPDDPESYVLHVF